jgi:cell division protein FtsW
MAAERSAPRGASQTAPRAASRTASQAASRTASRTAAKPATSASAVLAARVVVIVMAAALIIFGLMMVYSTSSILDVANETAATTTLFKQGICVGAGLVLVVALCLFNYRRFEMSGTALVWLFWLVIVVLLAITLIRGKTGLGAKRWLPILSFSFQPGEFAKIVIMLISAYMFARIHESGYTRPRILLLGFGVMIPAVLVLLEPDLGTALIAVVGMLFVMWFGRLPTKAILAILAALLVAGVAAIAFEGFRMDRIYAFIDPWSYASTSAFQTVNSFYAFGEGGLFGVGIGQSHQKYQYVPEASSDFIYAIIGEELGLVGAVLVALGFLALTVAGFIVAQNASDLKGRMIAGASSALIGFQAFLNMFFTVGWVPVTGKPLPFISDGGTSMIASMALVGLILSVSFHTDTRDKASIRRDSLLMIDGGTVGHAGARRPSGSLSPAFQARSAPKPFVPGASRPLARSAPRPLAGQARLAPLEPPYGRAQARPALSLASMPRSRSAATRQLQQLDSRARVLGKRG